MTINKQGFKDLSFSIFESAFKDLIKDRNIDDLKEELYIMNQIENKSRKQHSKINRLNGYLKKNFDARLFFEKRNFYPWIEFVDYDCEFIVDRYRDFIGS